MLTFKAACFKTFTMVGTIIPGSSRMANKKHKWRPKKIQKKFYKYSWAPKKILEKIQNLKKNLKEKIWSSKKIRKKFFL